jgi:hypothetical protein
MTLFLIRLISRIIIKLATLQGMLIRRIDK